MNRIHAGRIDAGESQERRLWTILSNPLGHWQDAGYLARTVCTTCLSTHISGVRRRLAGTDLTVECRRYGRGKYYYRIASDRGCAK